MTQGKAKSLLARSNDLQSRDLASRISRFVRAKLRRWCAAGIMLADDPRVIHAWRKGWEGPHFIHMTRWAEEGFQPRVVYDIGANEGMWSEMCQEILHPSVCVLFEPQKQLQAQVQARQARLGADWRFLPVALGDRDEVEVLHVTQNAAASSLLKPLDAQAGVSEIRAVGQDKVQVVPLDTLVRDQKLPPPDLVKIDVQGFEGRVLGGGKETLSRAQRLIVEVSLHALYEDQSLLPDVVATLDGWGFELDDIHETFRQWPGRLWQVDLWLKRA